MIFNNPAAFILSLFIPLIILLYLLKPKNKEHNFSSLYLWNIVVKELEANTPWQKLKNNIVMILQILAMFLIILALALPVVNVNTHSTEPVLIIIDASMSMKSKDVEPSRFDFAKKLAHNIISELAPNTNLSIISVSNTVDVIENMTSDKYSGMNSLAKLTAKNSSADFNNTIPFIESFKEQNPNSKIYLFSDQEIKLPNIDINFIPISNNGENFAIDLLSHSKSNDGVAVMSRVSNYTDKDIQIPVTLYVDDTVFDSKLVKISANSTANIYWNKLNKDAALLEARIDISDSLIEDNRIFDVIEPSKKSKILLVTKNNIFIDKIINLIGNTELFKSSSEEQINLKDYDMYIFDGFLPESLPTDGSLLIFNPPENKYFNIKNTVSFPNFSKSNNSNKITADISDLSFSLKSAKCFVKPKWGDSILELDNTDPIAFYGTNEKGIKTICFGFDLHNSNLPLKKAFPMLMFNSIKWLTSAATSNISNSTTCEAIDLPIEPDCIDVKITSPSGKIFDFKPTSKSIVFAETNEPGHYLISQKTTEKELTNYFALNTTSANESDIRLKSKEYNTANSLSSGSKANIASGTNLLWIFILLALIILVIEWWVYINGN